MKILNNPALTLIQHHITYRLPHLAVELKVKNQELLEDGQEIQFQNHLFLITARVFKPGDGSRLVLKDFNVDYSMTFAPSWWQKLLGLWLVKNIIYWTKSHAQVTEDLKHFFSMAGDKLLYLGYLPKKIVSIE